MEKQSSEKRFALLIDADNVSAKYIKPILDELSKYGTITIKRIFGDWTSTLHGKWKDALLENSITPIQQFSYTQGKNATDSAMIIDAMDILYTGSVDGFCIVSSDSDFTRLASRLRESGLTVIGMGEKKTPVPFRKACDVFTTLELLLPNNRKARMKADGSMADGTASEGPTIEDVEQAVVDIITENLNNGKSTGLGEVGSRMLKRYPDFDVRSYGTNLLSKLIDVFKTVKITKDGSSVTVVLTELGEQRAKGHVVSEGEDGAEKVSQDKAQAGAAAAKPEGAEGQKDGQPKQERRRRSGRSAAGSAEDRKPALPQADAPKGALPEGEAAQDAAAAEPEIAATVPEAPAAPRRQPRRRHSKVVPSEEAAAASDAAPSADAASVSLEAAEMPAAPEEPSEDKRPGRSARRARSRRAKADEAPAEAVETVAPAPTAEPEAAEQPKRRGRKRASAAAEPKATETDAAEQPEAKPDEAAEQPKRRGRKRASAAAGPKDASPSNAPVAEPAAAAPAKAAAAAPEAPEQPKRRGRKPKPAPSVTPAQFVLETVREAGAEGIILERLGQQVRREFKDFKVRDLGFTQFRQFVASIGGVSVEREGKSFVAKAQGE